MNALVDLELLVRARYPIIAVETWEEDRLQSTLRQIGSRQKLHVYEWSIGNPIRRLGMIAGDEHARLADAARSAPQRDHAR